MKKNIFFEFINTCLDEVKTDKPFPNIDIANAGRDQYKTTRKGKLNLFGSLLSICI